MSPPDIAKKAPQSLDPTGPINRPPRAHALSLSLKPKPGGGAFAPSTLAGEEPGAKAPSLAAAWQKLSAGQISPRAFDLLARLLCAQEVEEIPTREQLAKSMGLSERHVTRLTNECEQAGLCVRRWESGRIVTRVAPIEVPRPELASVAEEEAPKPTPVFRHTVSVPAAWAARFESEGLGHASALTLSRNVARKLTLLFGKYAPSDLAEHKWVYLRVVDYVLPCLAAMVDEEGKLRPEAETLPISIAAPTPPKFPPIASDNKPKASPPPPPPPAPAVLGLGGALPSSDEDEEENWISRFKKKANDEREREREEQARRRDERFRASQSLTGGRTLGYRGLRALPGGAG